MPTSLLEFSLAGTPYLIDKAVADAVRHEVERIEQRVADLRSSGKLTNETLASYYGEKRFEQVAESNALEGSTLSVGETQLAVLKGITVTGHDPAFLRDARALDKALGRLTELAKSKTATGIAVVKEVQQLIKEGQPEAGMFRSEPVIITGSKHRPPATWKEVMDQMEEWQSWSIAHAGTSSIIRATVLHAWLTHIHPFVDGNGRTARAISNLELIRAGFPPIIIKKKEKDRYIGALAESDEGGNLVPFLQLIIDRLEGALLGLEGAAKLHQGYDRTAEQVRKAQQRHLDIWNTAARLYYQILIDRLHQYLKPVGGTVESTYFDKPIELDDFIELAKGQPLGSKCWNFVIKVNAPGLRPVQRLSWTGFTSDTLRGAMNITEPAGPCMFWSKPNPKGFPQWTWVKDEESPNISALATTPPNGDEWYVHLSGDGVQKMTTHEAADLTAQGFVHQLTKFK